MICQKEFFALAMEKAVASEIRTESVLLEDIGGGSKTNFENEIPRSRSEINAARYMTDLGNILARVKGAIEKNGGTCNINDIVVMPK